MQLFATNLLELFVELRTMTEEKRRYVDFRSLPNFGGLPPRYARIAWSWDESSLLIGDCRASSAFKGGFVIVPRADFEGR